jgi:hypothetical protein
VRTENGRVITLDDDIKYLWEKHGWRITKETVTRSCAKRI